jgi:hypothetical protein
MNDKAPKPVLVLSDGTGETAQRVLNAALRQFHNHHLQLRIYGNIQESARIHTLFRIAAAENAFVVSTFVQDEARRLAAQCAEEHNVKYADLLGDVLASLGDYLSTKPVQVAGLLHTADASYFRRIEAVEYTVKADDGKEPRMLVNADIVLVGVSRTSKTPLSTYLAHKGYKVGNVPIVFDQPLPDRLFDVEASRVFALTIDPDVLQHIRRSRLKAMGMARINYDDRDYILAELEYASHLFRSQPQWPVVDVTGKAIEETAATILGVMQDRGLGVKSP